MSRFIGITDKDYNVAIKGKCREQFHDVNSSLEDSKRALREKQLNVSEVVQLQTWNNQCFAWPSNEAPPQRLFGNSDVVDALLNVHTNKIGKVKATALLNHKKKVLVKVIEHVQKTANEINERLGRGADKKLEAAAESSKTNTNACLQALWKSKALWVGNETYEQSLEWLAENVSGIGVRYHEKNGKKDTMKKKKLHISSVLELSFVDDE